MQILTINNPNFQKLSRHPSYRTKVKILKKKIFGQLIKKIWFHVCSVTAEMFEHRISDKNRKKKKWKFFKNLQRAYKDLIKVKKNSKLSHACVPLIGDSYDNRRGAPNCSVRFPFLIFLVRSAHRRYETIQPDSILQWWILQWWINSTISHCMGKFYAWLQYLMLMSCLGIWRLSWEYRLYLVG
jgi:hypothetical protein